MADRNVFVLGLNDFNLRKLQALRGAERCAFHGLLAPEEILDADEFPVRSMLARAESTLRSFPGSVDAVVGYMDFPVSTMLPILASTFSLRSVSLPSLLKCEHKYWSRLEQRRVVPEHVPRFVAFDPFDDDPLARIDLDFPFWVKPVKSAGSWLSFRIGDRADFEEAMAAIREQVGRIADPFNDLLEHATLPPDVAGVDGHHCLAEQEVSGWQCTLEGSVFDGHVHVHGVVDSVRDGGPSFARYQYPSRLPTAQTDRMGQIAAQVLHHIGFDNAAFNVEFFWDQTIDRIWLLEINTRVAQHHSDLFEKVDGVSNHQVMVDIALGHEPDLPHRRGPFACAATFFVRHHEDAIVTAVPSERDIRELRERLPGVVVDLHVEPGTRLGDLLDQDSYSYELAIVYAGARDEDELLAIRDDCLEHLRFEFAPPTPVSGGDGG